GTKINDAAFFQPAQAIVDQDHMIALYVEKIVHALAVAERGRIDHREVKISRANCFQVLLYVGMYPRVFCFICISIELHIPFGPVQISPGKINRDDLLSATRCRVYGEGSSISK